MTTGGAPLVDVVTVTYNSAATIEACVHSAKNAKGVAQVIVVDNGSADDSAALAQRAGARVIRAGKNLGFSAANNMGMTCATAPVVLFLNPDTVLPQEGAAALAGELEDVRVGIAALPLVHPDGTPQRGAYAFPTLWTLLWQNAGLYGAMTRWGLFRQPLTGDVDWVLGACLAMRREVFDAVGGWDERFFLYQEDTDLCRRVKQAGCAVRVIDGPPVMHVGREAGRDHGAASERFNEAILVYFHKVYGPWGARLAVWMFTKGHAFRWWLFALMGKKERAAFERKNAGFFWRRVFGPLAETTGQPPKG